MFAVSVAALLQVEVPGIYRLLNWGTVPDTIASVVTAASLFIAGSAYSQSRRLDRRKAASNVSAWMRKIEDDYVVQLKNAGDNPIYQVIVYLPATFGSTWTTPVFPGGLEEISRKTAGGVYMSAAFGSMPFDPDHSV